MTDAELKNHIDVLTVAIATMAVEASKTSEVTAALNALARTRPETLNPAYALNAAMKKAAADRDAAVMARMTGGHG